MTLASLTSLITLQYRLVPTSDPMMLILLILAAPFILGLIFKGLVILGWSIVLLPKAIYYTLTGRMKEYYAKLEEEKREEKRKKEEEFWKKWIENGKNL